MFGLPVHITVCFSVLFLASLGLGFAKCLTAHLDKMQRAWVSVPERNAGELPRDNVSFADPCASCKTNVRYQRLPGTFRTVSVGPAGVWAVGCRGYPVHRNGTYGTSGSTNGTEWTTIPQSNTVALSWLAVGDDVIWGITDRGHLACRAGINKNAVHGTSWLTFRARPRDVSVSPKGQIVGISEDGHLIYRQGLDSECNRKGKWIRIRSPVPGTLSRISVGASGIWAVDAKQRVFYRLGSIGNNGTVGTKWIQVHGASLKTVSVGSFFVIGVNAKNQIYRRDEVSKSTPGGSKWVKIPGSLVDVAATNGVCNVWGVNESGSISMATFY